MPFRKIWMLSLGCARNLVDAEVMLGHLKKSAFTITEEIQGADAAILNTCCFIKEAEEESLDAILNLCHLKKEGRIKHIVVCGCLAQRYQQQLPRELEEVDAFLGVGSVSEIASVLSKLMPLEGAEGDLKPTCRPVTLFKPPEFLYSHTSPRVFLTPKHFAYLKVSEGCNNHCSYCIIPGLRGKFRSRQAGSVLEEARALLDSRGVSEINLIGQDTTMYGQDLYGHRKLGQLLITLSEKAKGRWIRLLYTHPAHFSKELITIIKNEPAICKYIDLPIQHINDKILKKMNRGIFRKQILSLIESLRKNIPGVALRTTLIVGFPGETDKEFKELLQFIREMRFERLGVFKYSRQKKTPAYSFKQQVPEKIKQARYDKALSLQQEVCTDLNRTFLGKELRVLIDEQDVSAKDVFLGRTEYDAPEVDGCVYVKSAKKLKSGDFVTVKITDTLEYDLIGSV